MNAATPAKAAITSLVASLDRIRQVAAEGITVNCVAPGRINSEQILNRLFPTEESSAAAKSSSVVPRVGAFGEPEEIAAVITFLASSRGQATSQAR